jgi:hypothetical protein
MRELYVIITFVFLFQANTSVFAQQISASSADKKEKRQHNKIEHTFDGASSKGNFVIQPALNFGHHLGLGNINYGSASYGSGLVPGVTLNLDYNVHHYVSVGGYYAAAFRNYKTTDVFYLAHVFGARTAFHWWQFLDDKLDADLFSSKLDIDVHAHLGAYLLVLNDKPLNSKYKTKGINAGGGIALRYYFVNHFGVSMEFGYEEASWAKLGFAIKI